MDAREKAISKLGGKCKKCRTAENLQLHHITYAKDSTKWWESGDSWKRAKEAFEHPERFELLCQDCHNKQHDNESFVKMPAKEKEAIRKSYRDMKKSGAKYRILTKYEVKEFDARMRKKYPDWI